MNSGYGSRSSTLWGLFSLLFAVCLVTWLYSFLESLFPWQCEASGVAPQSVQSWICTWLPGNDSVLLAGPWHLPPLSLLSCSPAFWCNWLLADCSIVLNSALGHKMFHGVIQLNLGNGGFFFFWRVLRYVLILGGLFLALFLVLFGNGWPMISLFSLKTIYLFPPVCLLLSSPLFLRASLGFNFPTLCFK